MFWDLKTRRSWIGYVVAVMIVAAAAGLRLAFLSSLETRATYVTLFPAVTIAAAYGGFYPGLLATALSALLAMLFWIETIGYFTIKTPADIISVIVFLVSGIIISLVCEGMHQAQRKLRDSKEELMVKSELLDFAHDYIMVRDMDSRVVYWNQGAEMGYGFTVAEAVGQVTHELLQTKFLESADVILAELLANGHWAGALVHTRKDGVQIVVYSNQTLKRGAEGEPVSIMEVDHDITMQKKAEETVRETNLRLQRFNAELEDQVLARTSELQELNACLEEEAMERLATQEALEQLNVDLEKIVEQRTRELQDSTAILEEEVVERQAAQEALQDFNENLEAKVAKRTLELQDINAALEEEIMERQAAQEALVESRDALLISERQLRHFSDELQETNGELTSFTNSIAHDFRSPMVNIKGFSRELGMSLDELRQLLHDALLRLPKQVQEKVAEVLDKDVPDSLNFIYSSVDKLDRMVNALLGLARIGRQELVLQDVDIGVIVQQAVQSFKHQIETNTIQITVGALPTVKTHSMAMEQVIGNLVDNAVKYLVPSRPGQISINCADEGDWYVFSVEDNGRGFDESDYEKIFQAFRRVGMHDVPGDGMGLAYVRTLVRQLGGRVWCESELGVGTKMMFTVPK